jgi:aminoglycoside N3'-acetyltransferase
VISAADIAADLSNLGVQPGMVHSALRTVGHVGAAQSYLFDAQKRTAFAKSWIARKL